MVTPAVTWQDVQEAPDDGQRYEAIEGILYVTAVPSRRHQEVSANLFVALRRLVHEPGHGLVYPAPFGVEFPATGEGVQPDIVVVARERRTIVGADWIRGAPDIVVEILSPTTARRDRTLKRNLYRRQGVAEYWIVDPESDLIERHRFGDPGAADSAVRSEKHSAEMPVTLAGRELGLLDLADVFARDF